MVGATYGITETVFEVLVPWLRRAASGVVPGLTPRSGDLGISPALTALVLILYSSLGAAVCAFVALGFNSSAVGKRSLSNADRDSLWSGTATLALLVIVVVNAIVTDQSTIAYAAVVPIVLGIATVLSAWRAAWRERWHYFTRPVCSFIALIGATVILVQPRPYLTRAAANIAASAYVVAAVVTTGYALRVWAAIQSRYGARRWLPHAETRAGLLSITVVLLSYMSPKAAPLHRPQFNTRVATGRPNILLVTMDTVRADHLSAYGYSRSTTPNLLRLATETATLYTHAIASSNTTVATHASIFTGLHPHHHGAHATPQQRVGFSISRTAETLAEILQREGYVTAGIVANAGALSPPFGFDRGFTSYECVWLTGFWSPVRTHLLRELVLNLAATILDQSRREGVIARADEIDVRAVRFLRSTQQGRRPFFLFLNYMDAHAPYLPPAPFDRRYPGKDPSFRWRGYANIVDDVFIRRSRHVTAREFQHLTSQYDGAIAYLDDELGRLLDELKAAGLFEDTLIIVTSDHGEAFGESSVVGHGASVYQHQVHVPLIIKYPHQRSAATVHALVSSVDLFPTVLDMAEVAMPRSVDGLSLRHLNASEPRVVISESYFGRGPGSESINGRPAEIALYFGDLKEILGGTGARELYDLAADAGERENVWGHKNLPENWRIEFARIMRDSGARVQTEPVTDPEAMSRLRALGYLR
jgi:arylsulfatase A-like enzyme